MAHGRGFFGIGHGDKEPHADRVGGNAGLEIDSRAGDAEGAADVVERVAFGVRRPDTHQLRDFATPAAASFSLLGSRGGEATWVVGLRHLVERRRHRSLSFPSETEFPW